MRGVPFTVIRSSRSQQTTVSPPTATTRLIRLRWSSAGSRPIAESTRFIWAVTAESSAAAGACSPWSQSAGSSKTMTSPRWGREPKWGVSLSTTTRSPIRIVCSIDPEGITNAWMRKVFRKSAIPTATTIIRGISRSAERRLRRRTLRASLRRSARPVGGGAAAYPLPRCAASAPERPRGFPRLPMAAPVRQLGERAGVADGGPAGEGPADPLRPPEHLLDGEHAASG